MFMPQKEALWKIIVEIKYDVWGVWCSNAVNGSYRVGVWENIRRVWDEFS
jgi:hypothetical protein